MTYQNLSDLDIQSDLYQLFETKVLPPLGQKPKEFFAAFSQALAEFTPKNDALLEKRTKLQKKLTDYHRSHQEKPLDLDHYLNFLTEIGYLEEHPDPDWRLEVKDVDPEIAPIAGPQLVVPLSNARFALNAANARWGSLFDAFYGTDVIPNEAPYDITPGYNPKRGEKVIQKASAFLDATFPLAHDSHGAITGYQIQDHTLMAKGPSGWQPLATKSQWVGYQGSPEEPKAVLLCHHHLHIEIQIDPSHPVGKSHPAGVKDILMESAITTIMDGEDSVAAVDGEDKTLVYQNLLGLIRGDLTAELTKNGQRLERSLAPDRSYLSPKGEPFALKGRSLMLSRQVGHLMKTGAILKNGEPIYEGLMDAFLGTACLAHDRLKGLPFKNSATGSLYVVKPKMHGPEEVAFCTEVFDRVEEVLNLPPHTVKLGIMDEERRMSANLASAMAKAKERLIFINTGFLDRTGDEIHSIMDWGPVVAKGSNRDTPWMQAYEWGNVYLGLHHGLVGKAQIGKGMWAKPDAMAQMLDTKGAHLKAGASCAWVPSPTAATLHALHYHAISVAKVQEALSQNPPPSLKDLLTPALLDQGSWPSREEIQYELETNTQGILGYVVRWVEQGVGCSKVADLEGVGLMEDRATLRISSQHIANWLAHGLISLDEVLTTLERMAGLVDEQNQGDPGYQPMTQDIHSSCAFQAAKELILEACSVPSGYTEPTLHKWRLEAKKRG